MLFLFGWPPCQRSDMILMEVSQRAYDIINFISVLYGYLYVCEIYVNLIWYLYLFMLNKICLSLSLRIISDKLELYLIVPGELAPCVPMLSATMVLAQSWENDCPTWEWMWKPAISQVLRMLHVYVSYRIQPLKRLNLCYIQEDHVGIILIRDISLIRAQHYLNISRLLSFDG